MSESRFPQGGGYSRCALTCASRKRLDKRGKVNRVEYSRRTPSHEINGSCLFFGTRRIFCAGAICGDWTRRGPRTERADSGAGGCRLSEVTGDSSTTAVRLDCGQGRRLNGRRGRI